MEAHRDNRWYLIALVISGRFALGAALLASGAPKAYDPHGFEVTITSFALLPPQVALLGAAVLPWLELALGLCLISGAFLPGATLGTFILLLIFCCAISIGLAKGETISCGCFGRALDGDHLNQWDLARCLVLLLIAGCLYVRLLFCRSVAEP